MYNFRVYTLRDGSKRIIKLKEGESYYGDGYLFFVSKVNINENQDDTVEICYQP